MGYRRAADVDRPEDELAALRELARRRGRVKTRVLFAILMAGAILGLVGCALTTSIQLALFNQAWLVISIALGFFPIFVASASVALRLARWAARRPTDAWVSELAATHRLDRDALAEEVRLLHGIEAEAEEDAFDG